MYMVEIQGDESRAFESRYHSIKQRNQIIIIQTNIEVLVMIFLVK
jgi:hypothetical protein